MNFFSKSPNKTKLISYIVVTFVLSLGLSISFQSLLAFTLSLVANPLDGNFFRRNALINENNSDASIVVNAPLGVNGYFKIGTNAMVVDNLTGTTGIGTDAPSTMLDVNGLFRPGNFSTADRPTCAVADIGMVIYDVDINRPIVCTNTGWLYF